MSTFQVKTRKTRRLLQNQLSEAAKSDNRTPDSHRGVDCDLPLLHPSMKNGARSEKDQFPLTSKGKTNDPYPCRTGITAVQKGRGAKTSDSPLQHQHAGTDSTSISSSSSSNDNYFENDQRQQMSLDKYIAPPEQLKQPVPPPNYSHMPSRNGPISQAEALDRAVAKRQASSKASNKWGGWFPKADKNVKSSKELAAQISKSITRDQTNTLLSASQRSSQQRDLLGPPPVSSTVSASMHSNDDTNDSIPFSQLQDSIETTQKEQHPPTQLSTLSTPPPATHTNDARADRSPLPQHHRSDSDSDGDSDGSKEFKLHTSQRGGFFLDNRNTLHDTEPSNCEFGEAIKQEDIDRPWRRTSCPDFKKKIGNMAVDDNEKDISKNSHSSVDAPTNVAVGVVPRKEEDELDRWNSLVLGNENDNDNAVSIKVNTSPSSPSNETKDLSISKSVIVIESRESMSEDRIISRKASGNSNRRAEVLQDDEITTKTENMTEHVNEKDMKSTRRQKKRDRRSRRLVAEQNVKDKGKKITKTSSRSKTKKVTGMISNQESSSDMVQMATRKGVVVTDQQKSPPSVDSSLGLPPIASKYKSSKCKLKRETVEPLERVNQAIRELEQVESVSLVGSVRPKKKKSSKSSKKNFLEAKRIEQTKQFSTPLASHLAGYGRATKAKRPSSIGHATKEEEVMDINCALSEKSEDIALLQGKVTAMLVRLNTPCDSATRSISSQNTEPVSDIKAQAITNLRKQKRRQEKQLKEIASAHSMPSYFPSRQGSRKLDLEGGATPVATTLLPRRRAERVSAAGSRGRSLERDSGNRITQNKGDSDRLSSVDSSATPLTHNKKPFDDDIGDHSEQQASRSCGYMYSQSLGKGHVDTSQLLPAVSQHSRSFTDSRPRQSRESFTNGSNEQLSLHDLFDWNSKGKK